jgi:hypothetical protein
MYIRSTGLGKTLLKAEAANIEAINIIPETLEESEEGDEPTRLLMTMQTLEPVHWTVRVFVEPPDLRRMLWVALKSPTVLKAHALGCAEKSDCPLLELAFFVFQRAKA